MIDMTALIDYGMGNIHSVHKALMVMGDTAVVTHAPSEIKRCDKIVLPGVGAFGDAMSEMKERGLLPVLLEHIKQKKLFLGICLGMHLLFEKSEEAPGIAGFGVIKGSVRRFERKKGFKVPHMGWNQLQDRGTFKECPLFKDLPENPDVYFCHSYYPQPRDEKVIASVTGYIRDFASVVWKDNVFGTQFHPEKSQSMGLKILENFIKL